MKKQAMDNCRGSEIIEYIIVLPFIMIILITFVMVALVMHDRATIDGAAQRGSIYAAKCVSDPNYDTILRGIGSARGNVDLAQSASTDNASFSGIGRHMHPYRYSNSSMKGTIETNTAEEVRAIIEKTRIPWRNIDIYDVKTNVDNHLLYSEVTVTVSVTYPLPPILESIGLSDSIDYSVTSSTLVNDPDEFIRNADLAVDVIVQVDEMTGGHLSNAISKAQEMFGNLKDKLAKWIKV